MKRRTVLAAVLATCAFAAGAAVAEARELKFGHVGAPG